MNIAVLGAGMVGRAIALDLASRHQVTSFDLQENSLALLLARNKNIVTRQADLSKFDSYPSLFGSFDMLVSAVPGLMGFKALEAIIKLGKDVVDISFFPENALDLDALAREHKVTAIVDCGVAPGMSNFILGFHDAQMQIDSFECMVGGLPKKRIKPFEYKAPFSPIDVIEEYIRPARYVENFNVVTKPALSDSELIDFEEAGTLESFNTDGLRSILFTMAHIPNMKEKTLRYPGHIDLVIALKKAGFFSHEKIMVGGQAISPMEFTAKILFDSWKLGETEPEFTLMKINIQGKKDDVATGVEYTLFDEYDAETKISSMSRTTGYTCSAAVEMLAAGLFREKGVFPPELVGKHPACFDFIMGYLAERNIIYRKKVL